MSNCYIYIPGPSYFWGLPSMVPTFFFVWGEIQRQSFRRFQHLGKVTRYGNVPTITWPSFTYIWPGIWLVFFEWLKTQKPLQLKTKTGIAHIRHVWKPRWVPRVLASAKAPIYVDMVSEILIDGVLNEKELVTDQRKQSRVVVFHVPTFSINLKGKYTWVVWVMKKYFECNLYIGFWFVFGKRAGSQTFVYVIERWSTMKTVVSTRVFMETPLPAKMSGGWTTGFGGTTL